MGRVVQPATDPGTKDSLTIAANPRIPFVRALDNLGTEATFGAGAATRAGSVFTVAGGDPLAAGVRPGDTFRILTSSGPGASIVGDHVITAADATTITVATSFGAVNDSADTYIVERRYVSFDNVMFSNVQKRPARTPKAARDRRNIYIRLPGLVGRPIRPRRFIHVSNADFRTLRTQTPKSEGSAGTTTANSFIFTGDGGENFTADGVVPGDVLLLSTASGSNGRYVVTTVGTTTLGLDRPTPSPVAGSVTYDVILSRTFLDAVNQVIGLGSLEVRDEAGALVDPVLPV